MPENTPIAGVPVARKRTPRGQGRARLVQAATELFLERGVSDTSLQAIADRLGVTKAAVYHQFATKEEIVLAVAGPAIERLSQIAETAGALPTRSEAVTAVINGLAALAVDERGVAAAFRTDPAMARVLAEHAPYSREIERIDAILLGPEPSIERRVAFTFAGAGVMAIGSDRRLDDVPSEVLRTLIEKTMRRALDAAGPEIAAP